MFLISKHPLTWRRLLFVWVLLLFTALTISISNALASKPSVIAQALSLSGPTQQVDRALIVSDRRNTEPDAPATVDAFMLLQPSTTAGTCGAPPNGGTVQVGCTFVLDLVINTGNNPDAVTCQQSYLTFDYQLLQNARVSSIGSSCLLTSTLTPDLGSRDVGFDAILQNEVCDGPSPCVFRGITTDPGSIGYVSGSLSNPPQGGVFRVARMGLCATNPGTATLHWQFAPPAPPTRDSQIVDQEGNLIHNPSLYTDYVINIAAPMLNGHTTWQGRPTQPNQLQQLPLTLTLKSGTTEVNYSNLTTDANGQFSVSLGSLPAGNYNWRAKGPKFLANGGSVTLTGSATTTIEAGMMRAGDANNDNVISVADFNVLRNTFGKANGDPGYDDRADFNGDRIVNVGDVTLHKVNMGQSGAPPILPR